MTHELYFARRDELVEVLERVNESELLRAWNLGCDPDAMIFSMDEFNEHMAAVEPMRIANMIHYGAFNPSNNWFTFDGWGNLRSARMAVNLMELDDLAGYMLNEWDACELAEVAELLAEWDTVDKLQSA